MAEAAGPALGPLTSYRFWWRVLADTRLLRERERGAFTHTWFEIWVTALIKLVGLFSGVCSFVRFLCVSLRLWV